MLPESYGEDSPKYKKTLLLGIAYACNFGGMLTPISSMQNALAVSYLHTHHVDVSASQTGYSCYPSLSLSV